MTKLLPTYFIFLLYALLTFLTPQLYAQALLESRRSSEHTYIYRLSDKEAKAIYQKDTWKVEPSFFHSLVASFPTDSAFTGDLPRGHYIKTYAEGNQQKIAISSVHNFNAYVVNNNSDLMVQVYDLEGNIISDARVQVGWKTLPYHKDQRLYIERNANRKGLLSVTWRGHTIYYRLAREYNNSFLRRNTRALATAHH